MDCVRPMVGGLDFCKAGTAWVSVMYCTCGISIKPCLKGLFPASTSGDFACQDDSWPLR